MRIVTLVNSSDVIIFSFFPSFFLQYFETGSHIVSFKVSLTLNPLPQPPMYRESFPWTRNVTTATYSGLSDVKKSCLD